MGCLYAPVSIFRARDPFLCSGCGPGPWHSALILRFEPDDTFYRILAWNDNVFWVPSLTIFEYHWILDRPHFLSCIIKCIIWLIFLEWHCSKWLPICLSKNAWLKQRQNAPHLIFQIARSWAIFKLRQTISRVPMLNSSGNILNKEINGSNPCTWILLL